MKNVISAHEVVKSFRDTKAVKGVSFQLSEGEFLALLGPNGAGKTTLIEILEGIQTQDSGQVELFGRTWKKDPDQLHHMLGISLQETKFIDKLNVWETIRLFAGFYSLGAERCEEVLALVNLTEKKKSFVNKLSGGQRQRLALGISLLNNPRVLLLDEPTTGLDPASRREIWNILNHLKQEHKTSMILTTHYMEEAEYLCDRIIMMFKGEFIARGTLSELVAEHGEGDVIKFRFSQPVEENFFSQIKGYRKHYWKDTGYAGRIIVDDIAKSLPSLFNLSEQSGNELREVESRKMTLDDLFIHLTGKDLYE